MRRAPLSANRRPRPSRTSSSSSGAQRLGPSARERLRRKLDLVVPALGWPGRLLCEHPRAGDLYPRYLSTSAYLALATPPLLEMALERARTLDAHDAVAAGLAEYLERHIPEEIHGDEP